MKYYCPHGSSFATYPPEWGAIVTPARWSYKPLHEEREWVGDNGCFSDRWNVGEWLTFLDRVAKFRHHCRFIVAPDVVGNATKTLDRWHRYRDVLLDYGTPVAFVCQDGQAPSEIPECDAIFIGGTTAWKMSPGAISCIREGQRRGIWVHVGRVNSQKRFRYFLIHGADSYDGTSFCFGPDINGPKIQRWHSQPHLLEVPCCP